MHVSIYLPKINLDSQLMATSYAPLLSDTHQERNTPIALLPGQLLHFKKVDIEALTVGSVRSDTITLVLQSTVGFFTRKTFCYSEGLELLIS